MADGDLLDAYIDVYFTAFKYIGDLISAPMKADKLSFEQFMIMRDLDAGHELNLSAIARKRRVTNAAVSRQLKQLLERGVITQERDATDHRRYHLRLTNHGAIVTHRLNTTIHKRFYGWVEILGEADTRELLRIMGRVGEHIIAKEFPQ